MLGIGFGEMVLIAGLALVVIGPEKFPDFAKLVIRTVRDLRGYVDDVKTEVTRELSPLKKEVESLSRIDPEKYIDSLTTGEVDDTPASYTSVNEEDKKIMAAGDEDAFSEDPYGWQDGEDSDYKADKGAYPEETVGYGECQDDDMTGEYGEDSGGETPEDEDPEPDAHPSEPDLVEAEDDRIEVNDPGEPDVWTGR